MPSTNGSALDGIRAAPQRSLPVLMTRSELSRATGAPAGQIYRAFEAGELLPDAVTTTASPLFALESLPAIRAILEKSNHETSL